MRGIFTRVAALLPRIRGKVRPSIVFATVGVIVLGTTFALDWVARRKQPVMQQIVEEGQLPQVEPIPEPPPTPPPAPKPQPAPVSTSSLFVLASIPYWDQERAVASLKKNVDVIDEISLFWYVLQADGSIKKYADAEEDTSLLSYAKSKNVKTLALVANLPEEEGIDWDPERVGKVIGDAAARTKHIQDIIAIVEKLGFDGANIDYEELSEDQKGNFTAFIQELAAELHKRGKRLRVPVYTQSGDGETRGQDLAALGKVVDELGMMTYNEHWDTSEPGPIASIGWVENRLQFALNLGVPKKALFMGIGLFGYDWPKAGGSADGLELDEVIARRDQHKATEQFDEGAGSPFFEYPDHIVWYENVESVRRKVQLAQTLGLGGVALWRLGGEDPAIWEVLK